jgi:hypothetical protein
VFKKAGIGKADINLNIRVRMINDNLRITFMDRIIRANQNISTHIRLITIAN